MDSEDHTVIDGELRRRKRNNARLRQEEEDRRLIAEGEGKISLDSQRQDTNFSPIGPRKAKTTALKNASKFLGLGTRESITFLQNMLAWYEAERKKRPRSPSQDNHHKGERKGSNEGTLPYHCDDVAVELTVKFVE
jgi:hypothetical protein